MSNSDLDCNSSRFVVLTSLSGVAVTHPRLKKIVLKGENLTECIEELNIGSHID